MAGGMVSIFNLFKPDTKRSWRRTRGVMKLWFCEYKTDKPSLIGLKAIGGSQGYGIMVRGSNGMIKAQAGGRDEGL